MRQPSRVVSVALVVLLLVASVAPVTAQSNETDGEAGDGRCFPPGGHELGIGTEGPGIRVTIHTSLFTNLSGPGALGIEASGSALDTTILELRTGVVFDGTGPVLDFLANPFSRFAVLFDYGFELPMFDGMVEESRYESDESPVTGVESRSCRA
ncbi:DUF7332 family protein [Halogeometricum limi]|uniref:Uncharacterized protein n=1 Tax=Halogeometricum limi TaxID=555875 RepID=A0A1I6GYM9_9EURY|nr:hypothetical protein [Halogeometricum limi]SFR47209.1 hypothetical protein SAMN04488124_1701 [Halogeometricum limi]